MFIETFEHQFNWLNGFLRNVTRFSDKTAIIDPETKSSFTYRQVNSTANRLANRLLSLGTKPGDIILLLLRNCPEFAFAYVGVRKTGAILLPASYKLSSDEIKVLIQHNRPKAIFYSESVQAQLLRALSESAVECDSLVLADHTSSSPLPQGHVSFEDFIDVNNTENKQDENEPAIDYRPHIYDEVLRLCTSGTTSMPKMVSVNHVNEVLTAHDVIMTFGLNEEDITLNTNPWFHRGGCHALGLCPVFYAGGTVVLSRQFRPNNTLEFIEKFGVNYITGSPANLSMLSRLESVRKHNLSSLKGVVSLGAVLNKSDFLLIQKFLSEKIFNCYGTTETFWNTIFKSNEFSENMETIPAGYANFDDEVRIVRAYKNRMAEPDDLVEKDNYTEGEVIIRSPAKSSFVYEDNPQLTEQKFYKGFFYTGDTAVWNKNGLISVKGRKDDLIIVAGENVYPQKIEDALLEHPKIRDCIVVPVPDSLRGQSIAAYIVRKDDSLSIEEIASFCGTSKALSKHNRPRYFAFISEIPLNASGKKMRSFMKAKAFSDLENNLFTKN